MGNRLVENLYLGVGASDGGRTNGASDLSAVHAMLVGVKSIEDPAMDLVAAGDPESSYLWHKVKGDPNAESTMVSGCTPATMGPTPCIDCIPSAPCGAQMPIGVSLEAPAICTLKTWIKEGAMND